MVSAWLAATALPCAAKETEPRFQSHDHVSLLRILMLRSIASAMRLEAWPQMPAQAAILRDASQRLAPQDEVGEFAIAQSALRPFVVEGDAIAVSLTGLPGDAARGRALVLDRSNTCILCHSGPFPEANFQGDLAPDLAGTGSRWTEGQLRLRLVDASRLNPATIMPSYYRVDGLVNVGQAFRGKPILTAEQIEDMVAYLVTLRQ